MNSLQRSTEFTFCPCTCIISEFFSQNREMSRFLVVWGLGVKTLEYSFNGVFFSASSTNSASTPSLRARSDTETCSVTQPSLILKSKCIKKEKKGNWTSMRRKMSFKTPLVTSEVLSVINLLVMSLKTYCDVDKYHNIDFIHVANNITQPYPSARFVCRNSRKR